MVSTRATSRASGSAVTPSSAAAPSRPSAWSHTPTTATLIWLAVSLPPVTWDTAYVLLRPHTMEGGALHWPLFTPYKLYGEIDHVYGWKAWNAGNGFTAAQGTLNAIETAMYLWYAYLYLGRGRPVAGSDTGVKRTVEGRAGATALLVGFSAAIMTLSKTVLYCEYPLVPPFPETPSSFLCL